MDNELRRDFPPLVNLKPNESFFLSLSAPEEAMRQRQKKEKRCLWLRDGSRGEVSEEGKWKWEEKRKENVFRGTEVE